MEAIIDYEFLKGSQDEVIVKEVAISANNVIHTLHFKSPYSMHPTALPKTESIGTTAKLITTS